MRKLYVVERREVFTVAASTEEAAIVEAVAMMAESADESLDPFQVIYAFDEFEDGDQERFELIGACRALVYIIAKLEKYWSELDEPESKDAVGEAIVIVKEWLDEHSDRLTEME